MMLRVLIVDDERQTRTQLHRALTGEGAEVREVDSGTAALQAIAEMQEPWVVLLDLVLPDLDGHRVCRIVREKYYGVPHYIILMSARANRKQVAAALHAGADDFLTKPIAPDVLRSRLRLAARHFGESSHPSSKVLLGLQEGATSGFGELLVRAGNTVARILFHDHRIVWAHISDDTDTLVDALSEQGLERGDLIAAIDEARRVGRGFHDVLLTWGLMSPDRLESVLRAWIRRRVFVTLRFAQPQVLFVPTRRVGSAQISFQLSDVLADEDRASLRPGARESLPPSSERASGQWRFAFYMAEKTPPGVDRYLTQVMNIEGATSAAVVDHSLGTCEGWRGEGLDPAVVWAKIRALNALLAAGERVDDFIVATEDSFHLLRPLRSDSSRLCYLVVQRGLSSLGNARATLAKLGDAEAAMTESMRAAPSQ